MFCRSEGIIHSRFVRTQFIYFEETSETYSDGISTRLLAIARKFGPNIIPDFEPRRIQVRHIALNISLTKICNAVFISQELTHSSLNTCSKKYRHLGANAQSFTRGTIQIRLQYASTSPLPALGDLLRQLQHYSLQKGKQLKIY